MTRFQDSGRYSYNDLFDVDTQRSFPLFSMLSEDSIQSIPKLTVLKRETLRNLLQLGKILSQEMICPLLHQKFGNKHGPAQPTRPLLQRPDRGIELEVLFANILSDVFGYGCVNLLDLGVVLSPRVDCEPMLSSEKVSKELHVRRRAGDVDHSLETDILVQPD